MGDHNHGHAKLAVEFAQEVRHLLPGRLVEIACGFVRKQNTRAQHQGSGYGNALPLASGEVGHLRVGLVLEAHSFQHMGCLFEDLALGNACYDAGHGHVFHSREFGQKMVELKDIAAGFVAKASLLVRGKIRHVPALEEDRACAWAVQGTHEMQESGFSGTRGAHDGELLPFRDVHIDTLEDFQGLAALVVAFEDVVEAVESAHSYLSASAGFRREAWRAG